MFQTTNQIRYEMRIRYPLISLVIDHFPHHSMSIIIHYDPLLPMRTICEWPNGPMGQLSTPDFPKELTPSLGTRPRKLLQFAIEHGHLVRRFTH